MRQGRFCPFSIGVQLDPGEVFACGGASLAYSGRSPTQTMTWRMDGLSAVERDKTPATSMATLSQA